jgi:signal transduction histidine kinase
MLTRPLMRMVITWIVALAVYLGVGRLEAMDVARALPREDTTLEARADQLAAQVTRVVSRVRDTERARIALLCESLAADVDLPISRRALIAVRHSELRNLSVLRREASGAWSVAYAYRADDVPRGTDTALDGSDVEDTAPAMAAAGRTSGIDDGLASELTHPGGLGMSRIGCRATSAAGLDYLVVGDLDVLALSATAIPDSLGEVVMESEASRAPGARRWLGPGRGDAPRPALRVRETSRVLHRTFAWAPVISALVSALGIFLALRPRKPGVALDTLEAAAERIGRGDLEVTLSPAGGAADGTYTAFNRMTRDLKDARAKLVRAERVAAWRDVARRIAHEIKNPLTPIRMAVETLRKAKQRQHPDLDDIFEESTVAVLEEVARMERIVTEFSRFARMPRPSATSVEVPKIAEHVVQVHALPAEVSHAEGERPAEVKLEVGKGIGAVRADREQLVQVLTNLVQNAIDAAQMKRPDHPRVLVRVLPDEDGAVRIEVHDNGPGIHRDEAAQVLEPYYTTKEKGTGLGLAIVDRIVADHAGRLEIGDSEPLGGACVSVVLRREGPPEEASSSRPSQP